jgi:hypothetical protein
VAHHAMKRPVAVGPVIVERQTIAARDRVDAEAAPELGRDLEAAGKDDAVDFIFDSVGDNVRRGSTSRFRKKSPQPAPPFSFPPSGEED